MPTCTGTLCAPAVPNAILGVNRVVSSFEFPASLSFWTALLDAALGSQASHSLTIFSSSGGRADFQNKQHVIFECETPRGNTAAVSDLESVIFTDGPLFSENSGNLKGH